MKYVDIPPVWLIGFMAASYGLQKALPLSLFAPAPTIGWTMIGLAVALAIWAAIWFAMARTPVMPRETPTSIVTSGPYAVTRNPIYVADALILIGWGVVVGSIWPMLATPLFCWLIQSRFIAGEEAGLRREFPTEWAAWSAKTRRWF